MSADLSVYSEQEAAPSRNAVIQQMREWGWEIIFVTDWETLAQAHDGPLSDSDDVYGWYADTAEALQIRQAITVNDQKTLDTLYQQEKFGSCSVGITRPYSFAEETAGEEDNRIMQQHGLRLLETLRRTKSFLNVNTSAHRNYTGGMLQITLWYSLGLLTHGLLENPQEGEYLSCAEIPKRIAQLPQSRGALLGQLRHARLPRYTWKDKLFPGIICLVAMTVAILPWMHGIIKYAALLWGLGNMTALIGMLYRQTWAKRVENIALVLGITGLILSKVLK